MAFAVWMMEPETRQGSRRLYPRLRRAARRKDFERQLFPACGYFPENGGIDLLASDSSVQLLLLDEGLALKYLAFHLRGKRPDRDAVVFNCQLQRLKKSKGDFGVPALQPRHSHFLSAGRLLERDGCSQFKWKFRGPVHLQDRTRPCCGPGQVCGYKVGIGDPQVESCFPFAFPWHESGGQMPGLLQVRRGRDPDLHV